MSSGKSGRCHMTKVLFGCQIPRKQLKVGVLFLCVLSNMSTLIFTFNFIFRPRSFLFFLVTAI